MENYTFKKKSKGIHKDDGQLFEIRADGSRRVATVNKSKTKANQASVNDTHINNILRKYDKTGLVTHISKHEAKYADVPATDFQTMSDQVAMVNSMFEELPATERNKFNNDPAQWLFAVQDPESRKQYYDEGLDPLPGEPQSQPKYEEPQVPPPAEPEPPQA